jgi:hypothetical protein
MYDHETEEGKGPTLRLEYPGWREWLLLSRLQNLAATKTPSNSTVLRVNGIFSVKRIVSLSALDYVDCMGHTVGRVYQFSTQVKAFGTA